MFNIVNNVCLLPVVNIAKYGWTDHWSVQNPQQYNEGVDQIKGYNDELPQSLPSQFLHKLLEDMCMMIDIILGVLDGDRPLIIKARREEDAAVCQEEPVRV
jgi:hypothetical protein